MTESQLEKLALNKQSEIIEYYKKKHPTISFDYESIWNEEHNRAFTIVGILKGDLLQVVLDLLAITTEQGLDFKVFEKLFIKKLEKMGLGYKNRSRWKKVFEINTFLAYSKGRYDSMIQNTEDRPYWRYVCEKLPTSRDEHLALHDKIYRFDSPVWNTLYPPNGFNCKCSVRAMTINDVNASGLPIQEGNEILTKEISDGVFHQGIEINGEIITPSIGWNYNPNIEYDSKKLIENKEYDKKILKELLVLLK